MSRVCEMNPLLLIVLILFLSSPFRSFKFLSKFKIRNSFLKNNQDKFDKLSDFLQQLAESEKQTEEQLKKTDEQLKKACEQLKKS